MVLLSQRLACCQRWAPSKHWTHRRLEWKQEAMKHAERTSPWTLQRGWPGEPRLSLAPAEDPWQREDR